MVILGIDPGYAILGYGVLEADGRKVCPLDYGVVETKAGVPIQDRLRALQKGIPREAGYAVCRRKRAFAAVQA